MQSIDELLDDSISDMGIQLPDSDDVLAISADQAGGVIAGWHEPEYSGAIDYRIRQLSYSSLLTLHACPRKFQLYKLRTTQRAEESQKTTVTFAFGHILGQAIQDALTGLTEEEILWRMFIGWHTDLFAADPKLEKSFWTAVVGVQKFLSIRSQGFLQEYELVYYEGKPATELSFCIELPNSFRLRGFVDAVLQHKSTGKILVLECKTTGAATLVPASYKNSAQAIGYSIVLDHLFPELSSYEVLYLVYQTKGKEFTPIPFTKTYLQRAQWIRELLLDVDMIELYEAAGVYPMHGESCFTWSRECEYFQVCTLSTEHLTKQCTQEEEDKTEYQVTIGLVDLLETQLRKTTTGSEL